ncbi:MAG: RICIN domain-containing protein [Capsulimonas sp.]|uniref:RICIN domain-containing protein n=1 Tax=Capsulimonas sp. TaxID=2494211 RepID=UPI0032668C6F
MNTQLDCNRSNTILRKRRSYRIARTAALAASALALLGMGQTSHAQAPGGMGLVWADEFSDARLGATPAGVYWNYDTGGGGWGNNELQNYTSNADNAHEVFDGSGTDSSVMQIKATNSGGTWYSARLKTAGKVSMGPYGYYEARCKFPNGGKGYWPAFWFLGNNIGSVGWPTCGEIDVAEEINGQWENHQSLHMPGWDPTLQTTPNSSTTTYHNYGVNWQPGYCAFYVDGAFTGQFNQGGGGNWVFNNQTMYMLLNLAVGGNWPGNPDGSTAGTAYFNVDYVRQYQNGAPAIQDGVYEISASTTGNTLDCWQAGSGNGTVIKIDTYHQGNNQLWQVTNLNNGYYSIRTVNGGRSLDCTGCSPNDGTQIELWDWNGAACQQWQISQTSGGRFVIATAGTKSNGQHDVLDGSGCSGAAGANVLLWSWGGGGCQQTWDFIRR